MKVVYSVVVSAWLIGAGRLMAYPRDGYCALHGHLQEKAGR